jgi:hypothetical protein
VLFQYSLTHNHHQTSLGRQLYRVIIHHIFLNQKAFALMTAESSAIGSIASGLRKTMTISTSSGMSSFLPGFPAQAD